MSSEYVESTYSQIREVIDRLQSPVQDLPTLLGLLAPPLAALNILPPRFHKYNSSQISRENVSVSKHIPPLQRALLEHVLPAWEPTLDQNNAFDIVLQYFSPDSFSFAQASAKDIALLAYSTLLSLPLSPHSVRVLVHLTKSYPIDVLWSVVVTGKHKRSMKDGVTWEDCIRNVCAIPAKVANVLGPRGDVPQDLEYGTYFNNLARRLQLLISSLSINPVQDELVALNYLLTKMVNIGVFPPTPPTSPSQPSFFAIILPSLRDQLEQSSAWPQVLGSISSISTLQTILVSLLSHVSPIADLDCSPKARSLVKREATLLQVLLGPLAEDHEVVDGLAAAVIGRHWTVGHARILTCYASLSDKATGGTAGLELLLSKVIEIWTAPDHIKHSLLAGHRYLTAFVLLIFSYLSTSSKGNPHPAIIALSFSPSFITSITTYISHLDQSVRRCGMLVAEEVANASGKKLDFGDWDGDSDGRKWCREVRELVKERDVDADISLVSIEVQEPDSDDDDPTNTTNPPIGPTPPPVDANAQGEKRAKITVVSSGYDSDDSLTGYISEPSSSRSASPTPSELEEIEKDPTLRVGKVTIHRPVYLAQLGEMIRPTGGVRPEEDEHELERTKIALDVAEELIRRKRAYGTELEENAVNLAYGFLGLTNKFELEGFDEKRRAALTALVACCPQKAAPSLIEEFFRNQYSTDQRFALLNALVFGARELAGLPPPAAGMTGDPKRIAFPSKQLPPTMHKKYLTAADQNRTVNPVQNLLEDITRGAIDRTREAAEDKVPDIARERRLRVKQPAKVSEIKGPVDSLRNLHSLQVQPKPVVAFTEVAAEHFICPLMNRFWLFLRDEQAREARTAHQPELHRYKAAGTGLILSAMVLSQYLRTLAILVHMARNAPEFLRIIAPDALELAVTVGTRPLTESVNAEEEDADGSADRQDRQAAVLSSSLELAVIVIDGCLELDDGRSLGLEYTALVLAAGEWAGRILEHLEKGEKIAGGGGIEEVKLRRAAAGVALKVDELSSKWRRSMIGI